MITGSLYNQQLQHLKNQLVQFNEGGNWVTSGISEKIAALLSADALATLPFSSHTIAGLLSHITAWRTFVIKRLSGDDSFDFDDNNAEDWPTNNDWEAIKSGFIRSQEELFAAIEQFPLEKWEEQVAGRSYSYSFMLQGLIHHDYYHYGQVGMLIAMLNKSRQWE